MAAPETNMVAVDGTDALYYLIVRPGPDTNADGAGGSNVMVEQAAVGISEQQAATILRMVANQLDGGQS
jgi:hypothetical protein